MGEVTEQMFTMFSAVCWEKKCLIFFLMSGLIQKYSQNLLGKILTVAIVNKSW